MDEEAQALLYKYKNQEIKILLNTSLMCQMGRVNS